MAGDLVDLKISDYSADVLAEMGDAVERALERIGMQAEGYAKDLCPVDTGRLRNSITHQVDDENNAVYIGTNVSYSITIETGAAPFDKKDPSESVEMEGEPGHVTGGIPQPFLKPAVTGHLQTYRNIVEDEFKNA